MSFRKDPPTILLSALLWDEIGDESNPRARLLAHIRIGTTDLHLEAWEIETDDNGNQCAIGSSMRADDHGTLCDMMDCSFTTQEIDGREYVLVATPYGN